MKKAFLIVLSFAGALALAFFLFLQTEVFGTPPEGDKVYVNRRPDVLKEMEKRLSFTTILGFYFNSSDRQKPPRPLPEYRPDFKKFMQGDESKVIWFGHSTFLIKVKDKLILIDPILSDYSSPVSFIVQRFQPAVIRSEELPPIDYVLISHDHYDHLDFPTIKHFVGKKTQFIAPQGVGSHLRGWGIKNVTELNWWDTVTKEGIEFVATPAQHFSGRSIGDKNRTLWAGYVVKTPELRVFFSGDSGYDIHFKEVGEKYGPFDIAFIENGQYNELWREVHLMPEEGVKAYRDLRAKRFFPVHWGAFDISEHRWFDPIENVYGASQKEGFPLIAPKIGESVLIKSDYEQRPWWREIMEE